MNEKWMNEDGTLNVEAAIAALEGRISNAEERIKKRRKWDREHLSTVGTRVPRKQARKFRKICLRNTGKTAYAVLQEYIQKIVRDFGAFIDTDD